MKKSLKKRFKKAKPIPARSKKAPTAPAKSKTMTASLFVDERTGVTYLGVAYNNAVNGRQFAIFDCDLAESPKKLRMALKKVGSAFTGTKDEQIEALEEMLADMPAATGVLAVKPGFREGGFVLGPKMIGAGVKHYRYVGDGGMKTALGAVSGSLDSWKDTIGKPIIQSSYASFGVCFGLGACLPSYVERKRQGNSRLPSLVSETTTINLWGDSGSGKSVDGRLVAGLSGAPEVHNWSFTRTSLEESAESRNDQVLVLDDIETHVEDNPPLRSALRMVNQTIPSGRSKARSKVAAMNGHYDRSWCTFGISSSPKPIEVIAEGLDWVRTKGELVRFIDIAIPPTQEGGIFDRLSGPAATRAKMSSELIEKLDAGIKSCYGTVYPAFVKYLLQEDRSVQVVKYTKAFVKQAKPCDGWEERYAKKFAVAYAGGKLAVDAGILPWPEGWVFKAVMHCYRKALAGLAKDQSVLVGKLLNLQIATGDPLRFPVAVAGTKTPLRCSAATLGVNTQYKGRAVHALRKEGLKTIAGSNAGTMGLLKMLGTQGALAEGHGHARTTQLPVAVKIDRKLVSKPRFYVIDALKLGTFLAKTKAA